MKTIVLVMMLAWSAKAGVITVERIEATIQRESGGNASAVGQAGEIGLGQMKAGAVRDLRQHFGWSVSERDRWIPRLNRIMTEGYLVLTERRLRERLKRQPSWKEVESAFCLGVEGHFRSFRQGSAGITGQGMRPWKGKQG